MKNLKLDRDEYDSLSHAKFKMNYHIIFSTKYRRDFLKGKIADDIKSYMKKASSGQKWNVELQEIDLKKPNHIHLLVSSNPFISANDIVKRLKQYSTYYLWLEHYSEMSTIYWSGKHYLWTNGFFLSTIGDACTPTIWNYIQNRW